MSLALNNWALIIVLFEPVLRNHRIMLRRTHLHMTEIAELFMQITIINFKITYLMTYGLVSYKH